MTKTRKGKSIKAAKQADAGPKDQVKMAVANVNSNYSTEVVVNEDTNLTDELRPKCDEKSKVRVKSKVVIPQSPNKVSLNEWQLQKVVQFRLYILKRMVS